MLYNLVWIQSLYRGDTMANFHRATRSTQEFKNDKKEDQEKKAPDPWMEVLICFNGKTIGKP